MKGEVFIDGKKVANADNIIYGDTDSIMAPARSWRPAWARVVNSFYGKLARHSIICDFVIGDIEPRGASTATLLRRARYGGRKGRRATRRLLPYFKAVMRAKAAIDQAGEEFGL
jgi:hypothetical protein